MSTRKGLDPTIVAALIGVAGTIVVAVISIYASRGPNPPAPQPPTDVVFNPTSPGQEPQAETNTTSLAIDTETPAVEATLTSIPTPIPGQDWLTGCISESWIPVPASETLVVNGCLNQPVDKFFTTNGHLAFVYDGRVGSAEIHGVFTRLPASGTVRFNILLTEVTGGEVIAGIFAQPNVNTQGVIVVAPTGNNVRRQKILVKTMPNQSLFAQTADPIEADPPVYDFLFEFNSGNVTVKTRSDQINFGSANVLSAEKWLFLGYQVFNGTNQLQAEFYNLSITGN